MDQRGDQVSPALVTGAVTYNSLGMLATILQEDNEAYLQKGVKERNNKRWRKKRVLTTSNMLVWDFQEPSLVPVWPHPRLLPSSCRNRRRI